MAHIVGTENDDTLVGTDQADTIDGLEGNDTINGLLGADILRGNAGNDVFRFSSVMFTNQPLPRGAIDGGTEFDLIDLRSVTGTALTGSASELLLRVGSQQYSVANVEAVFFGIGDDMVSSLPSRTEPIDIRLGGGNDSSFNAGPGNYVYGEDGNDDFFISPTFGGPSYGYVNGGSGQDTLRLNIGFTVDLAAGTAMSFGTTFGVVEIENVEAALNGYSATVRGDELANTLTVSTNFDNGDVGVSFEGRGGDDILRGSTGTDTLNGGSGDDFLTGGRGADAIDGGSGSDTASYSASQVALALNLLERRFTGGEADGDTLVGIENLVGGAVSDLLIGDMGANRLDGFEGADTLVGGLGADTLIGGDGFDTAAYNDNYGAVFVDLLRGIGAGNAAQGDNFTGIEGLIGSIYNDYFIGTDGVNRLDGGAGDDILIGALGADVLVGGEGIDTASYEDQQGQVFVDLLRGIGASNAAQGDTFFSIENVTGTLFGDYIIGSDGANRLDGGAGNDTLIGALGADVLIGGDGIDTASYEDQQGQVFVDLLRGIGASNAAQGDTFFSIENVTGTLFGDYIIGSDGANTLDGGAGNDTLIGALGADVLIGGDGIDTASYEDQQGAVTVDLFRSRGSGNAAEGDTYAGIENATGSLFNDALIGNDGTNVLAGGRGADLLIGLGGADTFVFDTGLEPGNVDQIADFTAAGDTIQLAASVFAGLSLGALSANAFATGAAATTAEHRIVYNSQTGEIFYDADGDGAGAAVLFATVAAGTTLIAADFVVA